MRQLLMSRTAGNVDLLAHVTGVHLNQTPVPMGGTSRAAVTWSNTGGEDHAFDLLVLYGTYNAADESFSFWGGAVVKDQALASGASATTNIDYVIPVAPELEGIWDALAIVCEDYNPNTGEITGTYDQFLAEAAIQITIPAVAADITGVSFTAV